MRKGSLATVSLAPRAAVAAATVALVVAVVARSEARQDAAADKPLTVVAMGTLSAEDEETFAVRAEELTYKVCDECHALDEVTAVRRTPRDWRSSVTAMATKGASATKDQFAVITQYLTRYHGLVAINTAPAEDITAVLGLSPKEAQAIVAHRTANGRLADRAALAKVPDLDAKKLDEQPDAIKFD